MAFHKTYPDDRQQAVICSRDPQVVIVYFVALFIHYVLNNRIVNSWLSTSIIWPLLNNACNESEMSVNNVTEESSVALNLYIISSALLCLFSFLSFSSVFIFLNYILPIHLDFLSNRQGQRKVVHIILQSL